MLCPLRTLCQVMGEASGGNKVAECLAVPTLCTYSRALWKDPATLFSSEDKGEYCQTDLFGRIFFQENKGNFLLLLLD